MGTRADNREGSCREILTGRHKGKWRVQFTLIDDLERRKRVSRLFPNKTEGKTFLQGLRKGATIEARKRDRELTLGGWFDWLAENDWPASLAERTIAGRVSRFNLHVRSTWGQVSLSKIDPMCVFQFFRQLRDNGVGAATVLEIKRDLVRVFNQAVSPYGRVSLANPFKLTVKAPPIREAVALTPEQAKNALASEELDPERRAMLGVFLLTGLRLGEQMALTCDQLLFDQDLIFIDKAIQRGKNGAQTVGLPKGRKKRLAVMCPTLKRLLKDVTTGMKPDQVVWSAAWENKPRMQGLVYATWRTILKDTGLPAEMTPHDCRLTHINWIEKLMPEVSATTLKEHVGHAGEGVTQINYTRPLTSSQQILRDGIERVAGLPMPGEQSRDSAQLGTHTPPIVRT
ncbi:MAG: tyrosine-type recombinase/integrase [Armatimonadetes bacterium]|nr:tyrosine-type recombinase/integrase [Armatimonadota bacterium]